MSTLLSALVDNSAAQASNRRGLNTANFPRQSSWAALDCNTCGLFEFKGSVGTKLVVETKAQPQHGYSHLHMCVGACGLCVGVGACVRVCVHVRVRACVRAMVCMSACTDMHACMGACVHAHVCACMCSVP